jgi:hypothetical protein
MSLPAVEELAPEDEVPPAGGSGWRRVAALVVVGAVLTVAVAVWDQLRADGPPKPPPGSWTLVPHTGLGAWVDAYDWTAELGGTDPAVGPDDLAAMADAGVQTLYLQTSHRRSASTVLEPERLDEMIQQAHAEGMHVVAWYLPTYSDVDSDLARLVASSHLPVDGLAVDIESTEVVDPVERNARVLELTRRLRAAIPADRAIAAITLSTVHVEVVNPAFWPGYPYAQLAAGYDALLPMAYWTLRTGDLRSSIRYIGENVDRLRALVGDDEPVHVIGGIADAATAADVEGMLAALRARKVIGGSLYDWVTANPAQWEILGPLRDLRPTAVR